MGFLKRWSFDLSVSCLLADRELLNTLRLFKWCWKPVFRHLNQDDKEKKVYLDIQLLFSLYFMCAEGLEVRRGKDFQSIDVKVLCWRLVIVSFRPLSWNRIMGYSLEQEYLLHNFLLVPIPELTNQQIYLPMTGGFELYNF